VPSWDDGRIAVGNGDAFSAWVHDDLRVTARAVDDPRSPDLVAIVSSDLYMMFRVDGEEICAKAAALLPPGLAGRMRIVVSANHNHHGPDIAFDVNHSWYEHKTEQPRPRWPMWCGRGDRPVCGWQPGSTGSG